LKKLWVTLVDGHPQYSAFHSMIELFQEKWYGMRACRSDDYEISVNLFAKLSGIKNKGNV
jgi:hypothetical protein